MVNQVSDRYIILNADDFGINEAINKAVEQLFRRHAITSTSIIMSAPASSDAAERAKQNPKMNVGIHLTFTSDAEQNFSPIDRLNPLMSLKNDKGYFHTDAAAFEQCADPEEVRLEAEAQIQTAISKGIELTHLDNHGGSLLGLHYGRDFLEVVWDLCEKYSLPFGLPVGILEHPDFLHHQERFRTRIASARKRGIQLIDDLAGLAYQAVQGEGYEEAKLELMEQIRLLKPGITQITTHPAAIPDKSGAYSENTRKREFEFRLFQDPDVIACFEQENIAVISWRDIRNRQRFGGSLDLGTQC